MSSGPQHEQSRPTAAALRTSAHAFCSALRDPPAPPELLSTYFTSAPRITEHGPAWAQTRLPFLGKTFQGHEGCLEYFTLLGGVLKMQLPEDAVPGPGGFIVDAESGMVSVVGKGYFESKKTGKGWHEQFIYRLSDFDAEGKIGYWEIWADPLSAWEAVGA